MERCITFNILSVEFCGRDGDSRPIAKETPYVYTQGKESNVKICFSFSLNFLFFFAVCVVFLVLVLLLYVWLLRTQLLICVYGVAGLLRSIRNRSTQFRFSLPIVLVSISQLFS